MTILRTALLASVMLCGTVTVAVAQAVADPQDPHHLAGTPDAATAPSDVPPLVDAPMPEVATGDAPGGMMVMMTPEMMQMMMGMMADQCMMDGADHGEVGPGRDGMMAGADMLPRRHDMRRADRTRERNRVRAPMLPLVPKLMSLEDVRRVVGEHLEAYGNPRLRVGAVAAVSEDAITAVVETVDGSLVEKLVFDRFSGQFARADD